MKLTDIVHDTKPKHPQAVRARADAQRLATLEARAYRIGEMVIDNEAAIRQVDAIVEEMLQIVRRTAR